MKPPSLEYGVEVEPKRCSGGAYGCGLALKHQSTLEPTSQEMIAKSPSKHMCTGTVHYHKNCKTRFEIFGQKSMTNLKWG